MSELKEKWRDPFAWLTEWWRDAGTPWEEWQAGFVERLGLSGASDDAEVAALFERVEYELSDGDRWRTLTQADSRAAFFPELYESADESADESTAEPEPYWDGEQWLTWDGTRDAWVPMVDATSTETTNTTVEPYWDGEQWLAWDESQNAWLPMSDETTEPPEQTDADAPAADATESELVTDMTAALTAALEAVPEAAELSPEELAQVLSELIEEEAGKVGGGQEGGTP